MKRDNTNDVDPTVEIAIAYHVSVMQTCRVALRALSAPIRVKQLIGRKTKHNTWTL